MSVKEGVSEMLKIVCTMLSRPECEAFRSPVDWKNLELFDYPEIVKSPMDLGTVKKNIEAGKYDTIEDIANDVRLVWSNCMLYNRDGSEFYHLANSFSSAFEETYCTLRRLQDSKSDKNRVPTLEERMQLSHDIFRLDTVEMAGFLSIIEKTSPTALSRRPSHDEVMINIDAIKPSCFNELNTFVLNCLLSRGGAVAGKRKRKADPSSVAGAAASSSSGSALAASKTDKIVKKAKT